MITLDSHTESEAQLLEPPMVDIEALVKAKLKPIPGNTTRILGLLQNSEISASELSDTIRFDPVLASRVLRLANSPIYALERSISTVQAAVSAVGIRSIYDIVMLATSADSFSNDMRSLQTGVSIWEHSVAVALAGRQLSQILDLRGTEEAFTCGLLHDIGKNLLFQADQCTYTMTELAVDEETAMGLERELFGFDHTQVGYYVATRWGMADSVCAAILAHHNPGGASMAVAVAHIINVADDLVTMKGMGLKIAHPGELPSSQSSEALGLTVEQMDSTWESVEDSLQGILAICK